MTDKKDKLKSAKVKSGSERKAPDYSSQEHIDLGFEPKQAKRKGGFPIFKLLILGAVAYFAFGIYQNGFTGQVESVRTGIREVLDKTLEPVDKAKAASDAFNSKNEETMKRLKDIETDL